jgi:hypothetical protein
MIMLGLVRNPGVEFDQFRPEARITGALVPSITFHNRRKEKTLIRAHLFFLMRLAWDLDLKLPAVSILNVTWSGYSKDRFVAAKASGYYGVSSGVCHKTPEWPAESPICFLMFGGSVWLCFHKPKNLLWPRSFAQI